jgi:hypothetical protein
MYENTGISLGILLHGGSSETSIPLLQLTFDGTRNENDRTKVDSFLYYLGGRRRRLRPARGISTVPRSDNHKKGWAKGGLTLWFSKFTIISDVAVTLRKRAGARDGVRGYMETRKI